MSLFSRKKRVVEHPYFGKLRYMSGEYWEAELEVADAKEKVGVTVPGPETGPVQAQVDFCRSVLADQDGLFERCRPVFEPDFEEWTGKPFPRSWRDDFALVGLDLPPGGLDTEPWSVCYFVDAANHYFTAYFDAGTASYSTIDG